MTLACQDPDSILCVDAEVVGGNASPLHSRLCNGHLHIYLHSARIRDGGASAVGAVV